MKKKKILGDPAITVNRSLSRNISERRSVSSIANFYSPLLVGRFFADLRHGAKIDRILAPNSWDTRCPCRPARERDRYAK